MLKVTQHSTHSKMKMESESRSFCLYIVSLPFWSKVCIYLPSRLSKSKAEDCKLCLGSLGPRFSLNSPESYNPYSMNTTCVRQP